MDDKLIDRISRDYNKYSLWVTSGTALIVLLSISILELSGLVYPLIICVLYTMISSGAYGLSWKKVAKSAPGTLTKFYLVASALRMLTAVMVVILYCVISREREDIRSFVLMFFTFYIFMLVFYGVFFAYVEKKNNKRV